MAQGKKGATKAVKAPKGKPGRPSKYSEEFASRVLEGLADGQSLIAICESKGMPSRSAVTAWAEARPEFKASIARAREEGQHTEMERCIEIADSATVENWQVKKLQIWARQWRASKIAPKSYGDRLEVDATVQGDIRVNIGGDA